MRIRRSAQPLCLAASLVVSGPRVPPATAQLLGPEFQINSYTTGSQGNPAAAGDASGNFVVVWESNGQDGSGVGVFGQQFSSVGSPVGSEFQVNTWATSHQFGPAVAADGPGNFVVVWGSDLQDGSNRGVFGQRFSSASSPLGSEFRVNSYTTNHQFRPKVALDGPGNFVVVWESYDQDGSAQGIFGQRFTSTGSPVGSEFRVNTFTSATQEFPAVAAGYSGDFLVVWTSLGPDGSGKGIFGQHYNSLGTPVGSEFQVNSYATSDQYNPAVAALGSGNFVVTWSSWTQGDAESGIFGQRLDSMGNPVGPEFHVNSFTTSTQRYPAVAADGSGNFVVAWYSTDQDGSGYGAFGQQFHSEGALVGSEFQVNTYTTNVQNNPTLASDGSGNYVVAWASATQDGSIRGVFGQRLASPLFSDGFELGDACAWSAAVGGACT